MYANNNIKKRLHVTERLSAVQILLRTRVSPELIKR